MSEQVIDLGEYGFDYKIDFSRLESSCQPSVLSWMTRSCCGKRKNRKYKQESIKEKVLKIVKGK